MGTTELVEAAGETQVLLEQPSKLAAVADDDTVFTVPLSTGDRIHRIAPDGTPDVVAGPGVADGRTTGSRPRPCG